jgi:hypothetical protein
MVVGHQNSILCNPHGPNQLCKPPGVTDSEEARIATVTFPISAGREVSPGQMKSFVSGLQIAIDQGDLVEHNGKLLS